MHDNETGEFEDQAASLRALAAGRAAANVPRLPVTFALLGGHRRSGATHLALNLAAVAGRKQHKPLLVDLHLREPDVDLLLGVKAEYGLNQVLLGQLHLEGLPRSVHGFDLLPIGGGESCSDPDASDLLLEALGEDLGQHSLRVVDLDRGAEQLSAAIMGSASHPCIVLTPEPQFLAEVYSTVKMVALEWHIHELHVVVSRAASLREGHAAFERLRGVVDRFLDLRLHYAGCVMQDGAVQEALQRHRPVVIDDPYSDAAINYTTVAERLINNRLLPELSLAEVVAPTRQRNGREEAV